MSETNGTKMTGSKRAVSNFNFLNALLRLAGTFEYLS